MDVPLYAIALIVFSILYLAIGIFLAFTLIIALIVMYGYLAIRHGNVAENYPHSLGDTLITVIFIGVTWGIFIFLGPKNPIPFVGKSLTYTTASAIPLNALLAIAAVLSLAFLAIGAFIAKDLRGAVSTGGGAPPASTSDAGKPKQGVGA